MNRLIAWVRRFVRELRRRRVIRVAVVYAGTAFVILQLGEILVEPFNLPGWSLRLITLALILGFPLAVGLAWVFDLTGEGLVRAEVEAEGELGPEGKPLTSNAIIIGLFAVAVGLILYLRVFSSGEEAGGQVSPLQTDTAQVNERSIAVLPFEPLSRGDESETFARGVHDDLLTRLSNVGDLKVISRTSVQQYRDTELSIPAIADSLGVRWVVEGGVLESGGQVQVNAQLIDPRTDAHRWAESYERELSAENLFAIQGEITREIAEALQAKLTAGEQNRVTGAPTEDLGAYQLYVQGRRLLTERTLGGDSLSVRKARRLFRRAIKQDSSFALAWAGLADAAGSEDLRRRAARQALTLDPNLAEAHAAVAAIHYINQRGPAALRELRRAVELKPSYAPGHYRLGLIQLFFGRREPAVKHLRVAEELTPRYPGAQFWLVLAELVNRNYEKARSVLERAKQLYPEAPSFRGYGGVVYVHLKQWGEVRRRIMQIEGADLWNRAYLALAELATGDTASARAQLDSLRGGDEPIALALVHEALGNRDAAFSALRRLGQEDPPYGDATSMPELRYLFPDHFGPLRKDSRYDTIIREFNQAWGLNPDGSIPDSVDVSLPPSP